MPPQDRWGWGKKHWQPKKVQAKDANAGQSSQDKLVQQMLTAFEQSLASVRQEAINWTKEQKAKDSEQKEDEQLKLMKPLVKEWLSIRHDFQLSHSKGNITDRQMLYNRCDMLKGEVERVDTGGTSPYFQGFHKWLIRQIEETKLTRADTTQM